MFCLIFWAIGQKNVDFWIICTEDMFKMLSLTGLLKRQLNYQLN